MTKIDAINALIMCQELMLFDPMTGETHELWQENRDNQDLYNACGVAIAALREQAGRDKGCEYCNPNPYGHGEAIKKLITQIFNDKAHIHTFVSGNGLHTIAYPSPQDTNLAKTYSQCKIINYCPVCGKRLEDKPCG